MLLLHTFNYPLLDDTCVYQVRIFFLQFKARENSLRNEKKEVEERLTREKTGLEKEHLHICSELQKANEQRIKLESKLLQANFLMEELKQLQVELQHKKDHAVRQAEEMRQINGNTVFAGAFALTEFRYEEIKEATDDFDDSKKNWARQMWKRLQGFSPSYYCGYKEIQP
jgi:predicted  nucleic acid-binding Zn-ribbon protein